MSHLHITRFTLNTEHAKARRDLAAPYELHRTLGRAFPQAQTKRYRSECGVLFRVEPPRQDAGGPVVLVQSEAAPSWDELPPGYALEVAQTALDVKMLEEALQPGRHFRFRLAVNPTRRWKEGSGGPGARYPLIRDRHPEHDGYLDWLARKAARHGFALPMSEADDEEQVPRVSDFPFHVAPRRRRHRGDGNTTSEALKKRDLPLFGVRFDGVLQVEDPQELLDAVRRGIGPAKAFGFGLLSLAPAR